LSLADDAAHVADQLLGRLLGDHPGLAPGPQVLDEPLAIGPLGLPECLPDRVEGPGHVAHQVKGVGVDDLEAALALEASDQLLHSGQVTPEHGLEFVRRAAEARLLEDGLNRDRATAAAAGATPPTARQLD